MEPHPVTGIPSLYYPHWKRRLRYLFSLVVTIPMLLLGVLVMILSLNLNGYIRDKNSPIHVSYLATFAEPVSMHKVYICMYLCMYVCIMYVCMYVCMYVPYSGKVWRG